MPQELRAFKVSAVKLAKNMTVEVKITGLRSWRLRCWLGMRLLGLAAWLIGCNLEVKTEKACGDPNA